MNEATQNHFLYNDLGAVVFLSFYMALTRMVRASGYLHDSMLKSILHSPMSFFDTTPIGRIMNRYLCNYIIYPHDFSTQELSSFIEVVLLDNSWDRYWKQPPSIINEHVFIIYSPWLNWEPKVGFLPLGKLGVLYTHHTTVLLQVFVWRGHNGQQIAGEFPSLEHYAVLHFSCCDRGGCDNADFHGGHYSYSNILCRVCGELFFSKIHIHLNYNVHV